MNIDQLRQGQQVIGRYHAWHSGRIINEEPVRFVTLDGDTAHFLRQNDDGVWEPLTIRKGDNRMGDAPWTYGMAAAPFSIRETAKYAAGVLAVDIYGHGPELVLDFMTTRLGHPVDENTMIDETTAETIHIEWDAARMLLR